MKISAKRKQELNSIVKDIRDKLNDRKMICNYLFHDKSGKIVWNNFCKALDDLENKIWERCS